MSRPWVRCAMGSSTVWVMMCSLGGSLLTTGTLPDPYRDVNSLVRLCARTHPAETSTATASSARTSTASPTPYVAAHAPPPPDEYGHSTRSPSGRRRPPQTPNRSTDPQPHASSRLSHRRWEHNTGLRATLRGQLHLNRARCQTPHNLSVRAPSNAVVVRGHRDHVTGRQLVSLAVEQYGHTIVLSTYRGPRPIAGGTVASPRRTSRGPRS